MATSPGSGWASGPWSSAKHRGGSRRNRFPITLSESRAHRGLVGDLWVQRVFDARRCLGETPRRSQAHKRERSVAMVMWDALVVGGGPAGAAAGYWLAEAGHHVLVVEKKRFPRRRPAATASRPGPCASSTTWASPSRSPVPTASTGCARSRTASRSSCEWPDHPDFPVVRVRRAPARPRRHGGRRAPPRRARRVWTGAEAVEPLVDDGLVTGAVVPARRRRPSRCGRATSSSPTARTRASAARSAPRRDRAYPLGMAVRGYFTQPVPRRAVDREPPRPARPRRQPPARLRVDLPGRRRHRERRCRAALHLRGMEGRQHQRADGRVRRDRAGAVGHLTETSCGPPTGGKLPTGGSVTPNVGPTWLVVGDAAGSVNPFNGEGISLAYETGRMAADAVSRGAAPPATGSRSRAYPPSARGDVRPLLEGGTGLRARHRQSGGHARARRASACSRARSWSGCCGSWPTCCAPTSSAPPRPPTRWSPRMVAVAPDPS